MRAEHEMTRRSEQSRGREQARCRDAVGVKVPIKNWERGTRMISQYGRGQGKAHKDNHEQNDACQAQPWMRDAMKEPAKCCALQGPAHRDPLLIELNREN